jgi:hypothetical protein
LISSGASAISTSTLLMTSLGDGHAGQVGAQAVRGGLQQRRMERRRHRQRQRALGALFLGQHAGALDARGGTGDHDLRRRIEIDGFDGLQRQLGLGLRADRLHVRVRQAQHDGHAALPDRHRFLHRLGTEAHQRQRVLQRERAGGDQRRVFAEAVAGDDVGLAAAGGQPRAVGRDRGGQHHRLGVGGQVQRFLRPFGDQFRHVQAQRLGRLGQRGRDGGVALEAGQHADGLRTLAREYECDFSHLLSQ